MHKNRKKKKSDPLGPHKAHAKQLWVESAAEGVVKYMYGQLKHGGYLPEKAGIVNNLREEALDQVTYSHVLREQLNMVKDLLADGCPTTAALLVDRMPGRGAL